QILMGFPSFHHIFHQAPQGMNAKDLSMNFLTISMVICRILEKKTLGLKPDGKLITLDINDELETMVRGFFEESGLASQIDYRLGNARKIIPTLEGLFDLVFIDADKFYYSEYFDLVIDKVRTGGIILADNVLWSGKILVEEGKKIDKDTKALIDFNNKVQNDQRVENVLLPIRDGVLMARKL
ncbi:MAG TPA: class I SAM-dependent methyltransferase, partial [Algoriphagus sp.]|nr:class I SAM-dependent methyltransferase [Algoriphagus sp.]